MNLLLNSYRDLAQEHLQGYQMARVTTRGRERQGE